jgi:hypothetical protein
MRVSEKCHPLAIRADMAGQQPAIASLTNGMEAHGMTLRGRMAVVTGSTSGIGLGIARGLAAAGADLVLNGFGDAAQIDAIRAAIGDEFGVRVTYSAADISKTEPPPKARMSNP